MANAREELTELVATASALFYLAEHGQNPQVNTFFDAFHYIATSLSVGYANIFPVTQLGKLIGGVVMIVGPALSARVLEEGENRRPATGDRQPAMPEVVQ